MSQDSNDRIYDKIDKIDEKIERKFDKMERRLDGVEKELIIYNEELKHHIEGVQRAREQNSMLQTYIDIEIEKLRKDFKPVKNHVEKLDNITSGVKFIIGVVLKIAGALGLIFGLYAKYKGIL